MIHAYADLHTHDASRLLRTLRNHWRHRFEIRQNDENHASIPFDTEIQADFRVKEDGRLHIALNAPAQRIDVIKEVIEVHLQRFTRDETLQFQWHDNP